MQPSSALQLSHGNSNPDWNICGKEKAEVFSLLFFCRDAEFRAVFPASCLVWCSAVPFPKRDAEFCDVFPASCPVSLLRFLSRPRRRLSCRFSCVVSWVIAFLCGSVPRRRVSGCFSCVVSCVVLCRTVSQTRRRVSGCFSCVVSYLMSSSVVKGWVKPEMRCRIRAA